MPWLTSESTKNTEVFWLTLVVINEVGTEGAVGLASLEIFFCFIVLLGGPRPHCPSLLSGSLVVEGGSDFGVNVPFRGKQALDNLKVTILGGKP